MKMISVRSSALNAVGYDPLTRQMQIRFQSGSTYTFCRVPPEIFAGLRAASLKGALL